MTVTLYHYTCGHKLQGIAKAEHLAPSAVPPWATHEQGILWFSENPIYEASACKPMMNPATGEKIFNVDLLRDRIGLYRFALGFDVEYDVRKWPQIAAVARIREPQRVTLAVAGMGMGAEPSQWWGSVLACPLELLSLEGLTDDGWTPITMEDALIEFHNKQITVASYSEHKKEISGVTA